MQLFHVRAAAVAGQKWYFHAVEYDATVVITRAAVDYVITSGLWE